MSNKWSDPKGTRFFFGKGTLSGLFVPNSKLTTGPLFQKISEPNESNYILRYKHGWLFNSFLELDYCFSINLFVRCAGLDGRRDVNA
jgi:hypothetical protein